MKRKNSNKQKHFSNLYVDTKHSGKRNSHNLFVTINPMTPEEYKNKGENLTIHYSYSETTFGLACIASTNKGICYLALDNQSVAYNELIEMFPHAQFIHEKQTIHQKAIEFLQTLENESIPLQLHIKGTDFQLKVWNALLTIPLGKLISYSDISYYIGNPKANRAVGTAVGSNPVSFIIPCHRVIRSNGELGGYHWGLELKKSMIDWEAEKTK